MSGLLPARYLCHLRKSYNNGDKTALWDIKGNLLTVLRGHEGEVNSAEFSPDGRYILTTSGEDKTARLWDSKGNLLAVLQGYEGEVWSTEFSPDGRQILTTIGGDTRLWDRQGNLLAMLRSHKSYVSSAEFSSDGRQILTTSGGVARLWDSKGNLLAVLRGHEDNVNGAKFSPNDRYILTNSEDKTARLWDSKGNILAVLRGHEDYVKIAEFSPDGQQILTISGGGDTIPRLWNVSDAIAAQSEQMTAMQTLQEGMSNNNAQKALFQGYAEFSPNGQQILTISGDTTPQLWDSQGNLLAMLRGHEGEVNSAEFSSDGRHILTTSQDKTARLWDSQGNLLAVLRGHEGEVNSAKFSPDGRHILTTSKDKTARLWDSQGNLLAVLRGHESEVNSAEFSPDGRQILTASMYTTPQLWDSQGNLLALLGEHKDYFNSAKFSPDGQHILTTSGRDKTARLWDSKYNLLAVLRGHESEVYSVEFSPNSRQILTTSRGDVRLWDSKGNLLAVLQGHESEVNSTVFSPDSQQILTTSREDARLWDSKGNLLAVLRGHESEVNSTVFSPDGHHILTASKDKTARLWDSKGNLLAVLRGHESEVNSAEFSPNGQQILTTGGDKTARLWDITAGIKVSAAELVFIKGNQLSRQETIESRKLALQKLEEALALYRRDRNYAQAALTLRSIGNIYANLGQFQSALDSYNQALPLSRQAGAKSEEATILNSLGQLYNDLADPKTALDYYNQALPLLYQLNNKGGAATNLNNIGNINANLGKHQNALEYYNQALMISRSASDKAAEASALMGIGSAYIPSQEWVTALNAYNQALIISRYLKDKIKETSILNQMGKIHAALGQNSTALENYNQALSLSRQLGYKTEEAHILYNQAIFNRQQNNLTVAKTEIETAINIIESLRTQIASQELRQSYFARNQDYYQFYIDLLMQLHQQNPNQGYDAIALHTSERARARSLLELLTEASADIRSGVDPKLVEQERNLQQQLNDLEHRKYQLLNSQYTKKQLQEIQQKIDSVLAQLNQLEAQIRATSPRYANLKYPQPLTLQQIQQQVLDDDTLLLEYSLGKDRSYLWAVSKNSITSYILPKRSEIEAAAQTFGESLTPDSTANLETGLPLSQMLLAPVANQLRNQRLLVVGDEVLQYVPFAALPLPSSPQNPLLVQHEIVTLPSASTVAIQRQQLQNRQPVAKTVAVIADPVFALNDVRFRGTPPKQNPNPNRNYALTRATRNLGIGEAGREFSRLEFTRAEAQQILSFVPPAQHLQALDFNASRQTAANPDLAKYQIIHFATHGLVDPINPELSGVVLSLYDQKGQSQDGFLRLHDIFNLNLPAELVVLSACQTGLGKQVKGEGLVGLTRGFMYAGSRRVVVSLWSVNDVATSVVMGKFYQKILQDKKNPTQALREAQLEMWKQQQWQSPYYWAAFTVQGDWR